MGCFEKWLIVDMEREGYRKQIDELIRGMQALLDANNAMGERLKNLERIAEDYESLKAEHEHRKHKYSFNTCSGKKNICAICDVVRPSRQVA